MSDLVFLDFNNVTPSFRPEDVAYVHSAEKIICLSPAADYWADRQKLRYESVDTYLNAAQLRDAGIENYATVDAICNTLDNILVTVCGLNRTLAEGIPGPAYSFFYTLKIVFDAIIIRHHALTNIFRDSVPERIHYFYDAPEDLSTLEDVVFCNTRSLYSDLLTRFSSDLKMAMRRVSAYPVKAPVRGSHPLRAFTKAWKAGKSLLRRAPKLCARAAGMNLLLLSPQNDWDEALRQLTNQGAARVFYLSPFSDKPLLFDSFPYYVSRIWKKTGHVSLQKHMDIARKEKLLASIRERRDSFRLENSHFELLLPYLLEIALRAERLYAEGYEKTKAFLQHYDIDAVLTLFVAEPVNVMRIRAARDLGIPVAVFQHGGVGFDRHLMYYWGERRLADHLFVYGPALKPYYEGLAGSRQPTYHITGSPVIEDVGKVQTSNRSFSRSSKVCVYLLNILAGNTHYLSHKNYQSDIFLWRFQKEVVDLFAKQKDWRLIIKPHPDRKIYNPLEDHLADKGITNVAIDYDHQADGLMQMSDLVILDYPATSLLKAIAMKKEILVFSGYFTVEDSLEKRLSAMLHVSRCKEEFLSMLRQCLGAGTSKKNDRLYDEFLIDYAICCNDGKSVARIVESIKRILAVAPEGVHA
ncbi:MAG: hypothetical protein HQL10_04900 [Nitrospirae bacterium]|nr:hypothetical protein [Nitrospirota bacterium]